jgi:Uncharacterised nucleotidyltransferase
MVRSLSRMTSNRSRGLLVATMLEGAWRRPPFPPLAISQSQLDEVAPLLYASSSAGLGWWRVRDTDLKNSLSAEVLRQAFQLNSVQATLHEDKIKKAFRVLREASIEPLLGKGWLAAALYPAPPLRPYHDIDLCVRPADFRRAQEILDSPAAQDCWIDLHKEFPELRGRSIDELFARSRLMHLGHEEIRVMSAEDNLALLAIHLLKHGAYRSVWLCDIGAAIESLPADFDWKVCLGGNRTRANWIVSAILLANELLGARIEGLPITANSKKLPAWLIDSVLEQWANPLMIEEFPYNYPLPFAHYLRNPKGVLAGLRSRWPNPIRATISVNGRFNSLPRVPYQVGNCVLRAVQFVTSYRSEKFSN